MEGKCATGPRDGEVPSHSAPCSRLRVTARSAVLMGVLLTVSGSVAFVVLGDPASAQEGARSKKTPTLCGARHGSDRESQSIDLRRLEREYERIKQHFARRMGQAIRAGAGKKARPTPLRHDASLPACRVRRTRSVRLETPLPRVLRKKKLWFFDATPGVRLRLPAIVQDDPAALLFALRAPDLQHLATLRERLGRDIPLAPRRLAKAFGVRCMNTLVHISPDGKEALCHEYR